MFGNLHTTISTKKTKTNRLSFHHIIFFQQQSHHPPDNSSYANLSIDRDRDRPFWLTEVSDPHTHISVTFLCNVRYSVGGMAESEMSNLQGCFWWGKTAAAAAAGY